MLDVVGGTVRREIEAGAVTSFLELSQSGPALLVVEGEAGIGKTTLLHEAAGEATARGTRVLTARGSAAEVTYAYAAVADLVSTVADSTLETLPEVQRTALRRACRGDASGPGVGTDERLVAVAFMSVIQRLSAEAPVVVIIDDAQWLDASSRTVLGFAARRLAGRTGLLASIRTWESDSVETSPWLQDLRLDTAARVRMQPLSVSDVHALVAARLGRTLPRPAITRVHEISGGNPLFAIELAACWGDGVSPTVMDLPDGLAALVRRRIGRIDDDVAAVLLAAACAAAPTVELVGTATDMSTARALQLLESVEDDGVVELDGHRVRFTHPLLSAGVYSQASAARRRAVHRALSVAEGPLEVRARHLALASVEGEAPTLAALDDAADAAVARGAPAAAAELVELAIRLGSDGQPRLVRHAELLFRAGAVEQARRRLEPLIEVIEPGPLRARALSLLGAVWVYSDSFPKAVEVLTRALGDAHGDAMLTLLTLLRLAPATGLTGDRERSIAHAREAVARADALGVDALRSQALTMWVTVSFLYGLGFDEQALGTALELERPGGDDHLTYQASAVEAVTVSWRGRPDQARAQFVELARRCEERGAEAAALWVAEHATMVDVWLGRYRDATRTAAAARVRAEQLGGQHVAIVAAGMRAVAAAYSGEAEQAREAAHAAIAGAQASGGEHLAISPRTSVGFLEVSVGDYPAALAVLAPLLDGFDPAHGTEILVGGFLPDAIEALVATGRPQDAEPLVDALQVNGVRHDRPWMLAVGARGRGHVLAARGDLEGAERSVEQAMVHHDRLPMPFERARTQLLLGQLQRRRRRSAAATTLREALHTFDALGSPLWATRAREELSRVDSRRGDPGQLTAPERRSADLAAAGLTNKEIAATMYIAEKTVEMKLSQVYRKLGIRSRAGLSAALRAVDDPVDP